MINIRHKQSKGRIINIAGEEGTTSSVIHERPPGMHKFANSLVENMKLVLCIGAGRQRTFPPNNDNLCGY